MAPIPHLSLPVLDLASTKAFYEDVLGCPIGRERDTYVDVWFYGVQVTMHLAPAQVLDPEHRGVRHFGVTLPHNELAALVARVRAHPVEWYHDVVTEYAGTPREQTKAKIIDPSGNVIELKTYVDPAAAFDNTV